MIFFPSDFRPVFVLFDSPINSLELQIPIVKANIYLFRNSCAYKISCFNEKLKITSYDKTGS